MIRIGVIGAGLIGRERLAALATLEGQGRPISLVGLHDVNPAVCHSVAAEYAIPAFQDTASLLRQKPDWVMIALPHDAAAEVAHKALGEGANVLLEKPLGRDLREAECLVAQGGDRLHIGFNYRFFNGIRKASEDVRNGRFGEIISIEFDLGHGCAPGQEKTWKLDPERAGGGCLIDPGVHLLDLCLQLAPGGFQVKGGTSWKGFWNTGVEEEVCLLLDADGVSVAIRISLVAWRSTFLMRINGTDAYGIVTGRNRSYGKQRYVVGQRWGWLNAPTQAASEQLEIVDDGLDVFKRETEALLFEAHSSSSGPRVAKAAEGLEVMRLLDQIRAALGLRRDYSS